MVTLLESHAAGSHDWFHFQAAIGLRWMASVTESAPNTPDVILDS
jgi:hypothetical protein